MHEYKALKLPAEFKKTAHWNLNVFHTYLMLHFYAAPSKGSLIQEYTSLSFIFKKLVKSYQLRNIYLTLILYPEKHNDY